MRLAASLFAEMRMAADDAVGRNEGAAPTPEAGEGEVLAEALRLAVRVEALLAAPPPGMESGVIFRLRLARAHALGLIDQLSVIIRPAPQRR
jgi:hypothetical protein